ncbi:MAG TPA: hypothetical protein VET25_08045, partial [Aestuariivirgaceae bacterium]|nr:hypothetical protein [Aestuariivirgaceae bacterium]
PETQQADFIREVQSWASGVYTGSFSSPEDLERAVTTALHRWLVSQASGGIDESDLKSRADALFANDRRSSSRDVAQMILVVVPGPTQSLLRPIQLEEQGFSRNVRRRLLDDETGIFTSELGTHSQIEGHTLHFEQEGRFFEIDEQGSVVIGLPIGDEVEGYHPVLIEEEVQARLRQAASFAASMLEMIDPLHRITHALLAAKAEGAEHSAWRSRAEHAASPNSIRIGLYDAERGPVTLSPAARTRAALNNEAEALADDLMVLL